MMQKDPKLKQTICGNLNWKDLYISEPQTIFQKVHALTENLFEIIMVLVIIGLSLHRPSLVAIFFIVLS